MHQYIADIDEYGEDNSSFSKEISIIEKGDSKNPQKYNNYNFPIPLTKIVINYPVEKTNLIMNFMSYKIELTWNNQEQIIERRFSSFDHLRKILKKQLPFSIVIPIHQKSSTENKTNLFLTNRTQELNYFFQHLMANSQQFISCLNSIAVFFDSKLSDDQVTVALTYSKEIEYSEVLAFYHQLIDTKYITKRTRQYRKMIEIYKQNLQVSLDFYKVQ